MSLSDVLLVTDCDGTLLRNDKTISRKDLDAIARFREMGGNFTIATGRSLPTVSSILETLRPELPVILYNGSMLYDPVKKEPVWTAEIPHTARFLVEKAIERYGEELGVEVLFCGGIGMGAKNALAVARIRLYPGASGSADAQAEALLTGTLSYDPDTRCSHHEGHGHGEENCGHHGDHGCGSHGEDSCGHHGCGGHGEDTCGH